MSPPPSTKTPLLLLVLASIPPIASLAIPNSDHSGPDTPSVLCVFPLSGHYALLQRLNFYLVLLFAARAGDSSWLVGGAFAAAMSVSGVAALHALLLLAASLRSSTSPPQTVLDLDAAGAWSILVPAVLLVAPILAYTPALSASAARSLIRLWGAFVAVGAVSAFATLIHAYPNSSDASSDPSACPSRATLIRDTTALTPVLRTHIFGPQFFTPVFILGTLTLAAIAFVALPACLFDVPSPPKNIHVATPADTARPAALRAGCMGNLRALGAFLCVLLAAVSIGFTERWLATLPGSESPRTVGQWSVWFATGLVVIAGAIKGGKVSSPVTRTDSMWRGKGQHRGGDQGTLIRVV